MPITGALEVPMPRKENPPVDELYARGKAAERLVEEILLLNKLQSEEVSNPLLLREADGRLNVSAFEEAEMKKSVPAEEEAKVIEEAVVVETPFPRAFTFPEPEVIHTPPTEKQPFAMLIPPEEKKEEVAAAKFAMLLSERREPGEEVPTPTYPF